MDAAVAGGVTSLACPPDTDPPLDEPGLVEMLKHRARSLNQAHVYPIGALTVGLQGAKLTEMGELAEAGCVAFSHADVPLRRHAAPAARDAVRGDVRLSRVAAPEDAHLGRAGVAHDGEVATRLGLPAFRRRPRPSRWRRSSRWSRDTGVRVHLCRLSTAEGVAMVRAAKREGLPVTCDVAVHHLHLCDVDIGWFDAQCHLVPPLRTTRDRAALRAGVADGTIDLVCSDHAPVDDDGKQVPFGEAEPGATGLELLLPLTLKWAHGGRRCAAGGARAHHREPAKLHRQSVPAHLGVGRAGRRLHLRSGGVLEGRARGLRSQGKNTPFLGLEVPGQGALHAGRRAGRP